MEGATKAQSNGHLSGGCRTGGFSLVEVLVALLVLALGAIGMAALQITALRTTQNTAFHEIAVQLANDIADQISIGEGAGRAVVMRLPIDYEATNTGEPQPPAACFSTSCKEADIAASLLYDWVKRVWTMLPAGRLRICRDRMPWDSSTGSLTWRCIDDPAAPIIVKLGWRKEHPDDPREQGIEGPVRPAIALTVQPWGT